MNGPFARPLLATEHSDHDRGAELLARALAGGMTAPLRAVLPLVSNAELETVAPQWVERAEADAARRRQALEAWFAANGQAVDVQVRRGPDPYELIVDEARSTGADLLVIRRRGRRGLLANLLVGEMVSAVVAHAPCSVLVCPRGAQLWHRGVLVGLDPRAPQPDMLTRATELARAAGLPLHVVCVAESAAGRAAAEQALAAGLAQARQQHADVHGDVREGRAHQALVDAARERGADLVVVARHGGARLSRAWIGGTAQKVIGLFDGPALIHVNNRPKDAA